MKNKKTLSLITGFAVTAIAAVTVFAAEVGSESDPLVAKSYVDDKIAQVLETIANLGSGSSASQEVDADEIANLVIQKLQSEEQGAEQAPAVVPAANTFTTVYVSVGQSVVGKEGTELILRAGKGKVILPGEAGISDVTAGKDLGNGESVTMNHLLITPRDDGRKIQVTEAAWFMIKGDYEIQ